MAIADIVTMGYGTFSSVNKIPTLGFTSFIPDPVDITSDTTIVVSRGLPTSRLRVTETTDEFVVQAEVGLAISTETTLIETGG